MAQLSKLRVAVLVTDGFEESELTEPVKALREAGAQVDVISPHCGVVQGFKHHDKTIQIRVDRTLEEVQPGEYQALLLPGGALNADALRADIRAQLFIRALQDANRPIAAICHAPWILISSGLVQERTLTSYFTIQDDVRNAGGTWVDQETSLDRNWITSRQPSDIPAFNREMVQLFSKTPWVKAQRQAA